MPVLIQFGVSTASCTCVIPLQFILRKPDWDLAFCCVNFLISGSLGRVKWDNLRPEISTDLFHILALSLD